MIEPTPGRIVWYTPSTISDQNPDYGLCHLDTSKPLAAMVVHVWSSRMVNLVVFDSNGLPHQRTSVDLLQDDDAPLKLGRYAQWMPYQVGQAKRHDAEKAAG